MGKRFIDTGLFDDDWFMDLGKDSKLLWIYFITKCNHAGILKLNEKLCKVQTDIKDLNKIIIQLGNRIITVSEQLYFIPKFIEYQYPGFPNSKAKAQQSAIEILYKLGLMKEGILTVSQLLPNSYNNNNGNSNDKDKSKDKSKEDKIDEKNIIPPTLGMIKKYCDERKNNINPNLFMSNNESKGWMIGKHKMKDWQSAIRTWEEKNNQDNPAPQNIIPVFGEPGKDWRTIK